MNRNDFPHQVNHVLEALSVCLNLEYPVELNTQWEYKMSLTGPYGLAFLAVFREVVSALELKGSSAFDDIDNLQGRLIMTLLVELPDDESRISALENMTSTHAWE